jgi:hypothetical protein
MDDDTIEPRDWRTHPGAKVGAWTVELPLLQLLGPRGDDEDESELVQSLLESLRAQ